MTIYNLQYNMARSPAPGDKDLGFGPRRDGLVILYFSSSRHAGSMVRVRDSQLASLLRL